MKRITAQESIPYREMARDGVCRIRNGYYSKTLQFFDINYRLAQREDKAKQFKILKDLLHRHDVDLCVNACDAGREGELIFWNVYEMAGATLPVKRLWISSLEESAIIDGFNRLKDASFYQGTHEAALCRARADP